MTSLPEGVAHWPMALSLQEQRDLVEAIRLVVAEAPLYVPTMPRTGKPMRVRMTNCGSLGWVTDKEKGYRYQATHPQTGRPWPDIPDALIGYWERFANCELLPEACLINFYDADAKMSMHQDRDESELSAPVLSISLGDTCLFRVGRTQRGGKTTSFKLNSGDVVVLGGASRLCFHGVDRIYPDTSTLLSKGGRVNLTLRRVNPPS